MNQPLSKRLVAEAVGTFFLLAAVVGSGIMAERLAGGNTAIALLANTAATGAALLALILAFGLISGAHFNPLVTLASATRRGLAWRDAPYYVLAQVVGAFSGVVAANLMFGLPGVFFSQHPRAGPALMFSEFVATFGLICIILAASRSDVAVVAVAVAAYISAAYWFTASTSFANPAVTFARSFSDTFAGIRFVDVPGFVLAQSAGAMVATLLFGWLMPAETQKKSKGELTMGNDQPYKVLFLCTGNSARSILSEYLLRRIGGARFEVYSAGSFPTGKVNPFALTVLKEIYHIDASGAQSKSWEKFGGTEFDFVITVCDNARESCPIWPGQPIIAHWGLPDPALANGSADEIYRTFKHVALQLQRRIDLFVALPLEKLDRLKLAKLTNEIGENQLDMTAH